MVERVEEGVKSEGFFVMKEIGVYALTRKGADLRMVYYDKKPEQFNFKEERVINDERWETIL
ncbi:MAG: hypothetical protein HQK96_04835 [Nitrospirae bacterium]|nr:hypothetical protein [Nitrospirota bacterium]